MFTYLLLFLFIFLCDHDREKEKRKSDLSRLEGELELQIKSIEERAKSEVSFLLYNHLLVLVSFHVCTLQTNIYNYLL